MLMKRCSLACLSHSCLLISKYLHMLALISVLAVQERADSGPLPSADNPQQLPQRLPAFTQQQQRTSESGRSPTLVADPVNPFGERAVFS